MRTTARMRRLGLLFALVVGAPAAGCGSFLDLDWTPADGAGGAGGGSSSAAGEPDAGLPTSGGAECVADDDCPGSGPCVKASCAEGACTLVDLGAGTACASGVCDGHGSCVGCNVDADCSSGRCVAHACATCADGVQNGAETAVDCGGGDCPPCANGKTCGDDADCASGHCDDGHCKKPPHEHG